MELLLNFSETSFNTKVGTISLFICIAQIVNNLCFHTQSFSLFIVVMFWKVPANTELMDTDPLLLGKI